MDTRNPPNVALLGSSVVVLEHSHFGSILHVLSPWNMNNCNTIIANPVATLNHATDLNWSMSNSERMATTPIQ